MGKPMSTRAWDGGPALSPEDWAAEATGDETNDVMLLPNGEMRCVFYGADLIVPDQSRHAHAAIALYGMPFGFAQPDVDFLTRLIDHGTMDFEFWKVNVESLRARIAALLPPPSAQIAHG